MVRAVRPIPEPELGVGSRDVPEVRGAGGRRRRVAGPVAEGAVALLGVRRRGRGLPGVAPPPGPLAVGDLRS